ncbi:TPA: hypothetical protein HA265_03025 [Candidatus Woesearchaeota archaeon]|nr:hypothetical protein [Candidatus Woesearchaeota archaeon]
MNSIQRPDCVVALDADYTLCSRMTPEPLFRSRGITLERFIRKVKCLEEVLEMGDPAFYLQFLSEVNNGKLQGVTKEEMKRSGSRVPLYRGVGGFLTDLAMSERPKVRVDVVSMGMREIIEGIASIGMAVRKTGGGIYATSLYNGKGMVKYLNDAPMIVTREMKPMIMLMNAAQLEGTAEKHVGMERFLYIGDSECDEPTFDMMRERGGTSLLVFDENDERRREYADRMKKEGRVTETAPADYTRGSGAYTFAMEWVRQQAH